MATRVVAKIYRPIFLFVVSADEITERKSKRKVRERFTETDFLRFAL